MLVVVSGCLGMLQSDVSGSAAVNDYDIGQIVDVFGGGFHFAHGSPPRAAVAVAMVRRAIQAPLSIFY
jgi:hypothetical protein